MLPGNVRETSSALALKLQFLTCSGVRRKETTDAVRWALVDG